MSLTEVQQQLLNYFKLVHITSYVEATKVLEEVNNNVNLSAETQLAEEIYAINEIIRQYDFEIIKCIDEITYEKILILINTADTEVTQKAEFHNKNILQFFSEIVKECILSDNGCIMETNCLNLSTKFKLTKTASQALMENFTKTKWLFSRAGTISLGIRAIAELKESIKQCYFDIVKHCLLCRDFVLQGFDCPNCLSRYHYSCYEKYCLKKNNICVKCKSNWFNTPEILEKKNGCEFSLSDSVSSTSKKIKIEYV